VKGGTDLVFVPGAGGPDYVYLLKGYKNEFWRYDVMKDSWQALADAPLGTSGKNKYDKGSWLVYDNQNTIYCHKAKYHELFTYDVALGTWTAQLSGMPFVGMSGKSKRSKDGGSAAFLYGNTYALKGGNTQEFWQYDPGTDSWTELDTMPQVGSSGRKKKVKAGGDLTAATDALYALKGNKTNELWWYVPAAGTGCRASGGAEGTMSGARTIDDHRLTVSPNPLRPGFALLRLDDRAALSSSGPVTVGIFDAAGRCILSSSFELRTSSFALDLRSVRTGVYIVRLAAGGFGVTQKLVVDN